MKKIIRGMLAATVLAGSTAVATPAFAQTEPLGDFVVSANVALVSDYRFRGISLSGGEMAIQGGVDIAHASGFYVGTWASSIEEDLGYGSTELDFYAGFGTDLTENLAVDVGILLYAYPDADNCNCDYWEPYASLSTAFGPLEATAGVAYAFGQDSLDFVGTGEDDNLYLYTDLGVGIPNTPVSLSAHLGWTDGVLSPDYPSSAFDWSLGAAITVFEKLELGVAYVDTEGPSVNDFSDSAVIGTLSASF